MYAAGVFNGVSNVTPSHRAAIPTPWMLQILPKPGSVVQGAALDLRRGVFLNRTAFAPGTPGCLGGGVVEQRFLASSCHLDLLLWQVSLVEGAGPCGVDVEWRLPLPAMTLGDFASPAWAASSGGAGLFAANAISAEVPGQAVRSVALALQHRGVAAPGDSMTGSRTGAVTLTAGNRTASFPAAVHSDLDSADPAETALRRSELYRDSDGDALRRCSEGDWEQSRWRSGVEVGGNASVAAALNSSMFHLLAAGAAEWPFSYSPSGLGFGGMERARPPGGKELSVGYNGHSFWDADLWIGKGLALLRPDLAGMIVEYRAARLAEARRRAVGYGFLGASWPWESAFTGVDCVVEPNIEGIYEQHISADVALGLRWLYRLTGNRTWLERVAWPMLEPTCAFWHCRFRRTGAVGGPVPPGGPRCGPKDGSGNFTVWDVQPPDEHAGVVNSSIYTNAAAAATLRFCVDAAAVLGRSHAIPAAEYAAIADAVYLPISRTLWPGHAVHPEFDGYSGQSVNQASVTLIQWPLEWPGVPDDVLQADLAYYASKVPFDGMFTGDSSLSVAALQLGNRTLADAQWQLGLLHDNTPFGVWKERAATIGNPNFLTGVGGMLQNVLNGFLGLRAPGDGTLRLLAPSLPRHTTSLVARGLAFAGRRLRVGVNASGSVCARTMPGFDSRLQDFRVCCGRGCPARWAPDARRSHLSVASNSTAGHLLSGRLSGAEGAHGLVLVDANGIAQPILADSDVCAQSVPGAFLEVRPER